MTRSASEANAGTRRGARVTDMIVHVVGARPNFMKAAPVVDAVASLDLPQLVVHTGQHYDTRMSDVFFRQLGMPEPHVNLGVGSGTHAQQTAQTMMGLEKVFTTLQPGIVVVYGDINSTLAAALVAAKLQIPVAHVEAGLRSFDRSMPEEVNRRLTDALCDLHFVTSPEAIAYLADEGVGPDSIHLVGNPMIDTLRRNLPRFDAARARATLDLDGPYVVCTLHRPSNVDSGATARALVESLHAVADMATVVVPLHPRGRATLEDAGMGHHPDLMIIEPLGYVEFLSLVRGAALVITDSGGIQEETTVLGVPCLTVRPNTERPVTVSHGTNRLVTPAQVPEYAKALLTEPLAPVAEGPPLWDGASGPRIAAVLQRWLAEHEVAC